MRLGQWIGLVIMLAFVGLGLTLAWSNYRECRAAGFSVVYCASTHLVK